MSIKIEISKNDIPLLKEFYAKLKEANDQRVAEVLAEKERIDAMMRNLDMQEDFEGFDFDLDAPEDIDKYRPLTTWEEKLKFALGRLGKPSTTAEIVSFLEAYEEGIKDKSRSLSAILSDGVKEGKFYKPAGVSGYPKYGLKEWEPTPIYSTDTSDDLPF